MSELGLAMLGGMLLSVIVVLLFSGGNGDD